MIGRDRAGVGIPVIVRLAGAPASFLDAFEHPRLLELLASGREKEAEVELFRQDLVARLYPLISRDDLAERRFLLKLKRDAFNGRAIQRLRAHELWPVVDDWTQGRLEELAEAEQERNALQLELERCFEEALGAERTALLAFGEDADFKRGLALASPQIARARRRYSGRSGRRAQAMEKSLLRYATRTVVKISPYSTLTPITLVHLQPDVATAQFRAGGRNGESVVRIKRHLLDPVCRRLFNHQDLLSEFAIGLNPTLEILGEGKCRFLRGRAAERDEAAGGVGAAASLVVVALEGAWFDLLHTHLIDGQAQPFRDLQKALDDLEGPEPQEDNAALLRELVGLGLLEARPPWPSYTPRLEEALWSFLTALPAAWQPRVRSLTAPLTAILAAEQQLPEQPRPEESVECFADSLGELHEAVAKLTATSDLKFPEPDSRSVYEDVVLGRADGESILDLSFESLHRAQTAVDPLWRLSSIFSPSHEVKLSLSAFFASSYGEASSVSLMRLFADTLKLWRRASPRLKGTSEEIFDPFGLPQITALRELRTRVKHALDEALVQSSQDQGSLSFSSDRVLEICRQIPDDFQSPSTGGLCLQSVDPLGSTWVANEVFAAVGRISARFSSVLPADRKDSYLESTLAASRIHFAGEAFELLDLMFTKGNTVNVHWPQTPKVFVGPGETVDLPGDRVVRPRDLIVQRGSSGRLSLATTAGERLLPVFLSPMNDSYLPQLWQFLLLFGVPSGSVYLPESSISVAAGIEELPRISIGTVILRRRQWRIAADLVPRFEGDDLRDFVRFENWRRDLGLPQQVYVREKLSGDSVVANRFKPQFVDFGSPSLLAILREATSDRDDLVLVEALPIRHKFPFDPESAGRRTYEVVIDNPLSVKTGRMTKR